MVAVSTWSSILLAENDSPTLYARSRERVGCLSSASPVGNSCGEDELATAEQHDRYGGRHQRAMEPRTRNATTTMGRSVTPLEIRSPQSRDRSTVLVGGDFHSYSNNRGTASRRQGTRTRSLARVCQSTSNNSTLAWSGFPDPPDESGSEADFFSLFPPSSISTESPPPRFVINAFPCGFE